jgi:predicted RNase H-like HicB family nuclease
VHVRAAQIIYDEPMRTYAYKVIVEPDEGGWHAYCPALREHGAVTQGSTEGEALKNINEVVQMIIGELIAERRCRGGTSGAKLN